MQNIFSVVGFFFAGLADRLSSTEMFTDVKGHLAEQRKYEDKPIKQGGQPNSTDALVLHIPILRSSTFYLHSKQLCGIYKHKCASRVIIDAQ